MSDVRWTAKAPALIGGILLLIAGVFGWKRSAVAGLILFALSAGFVGYSLTLKDWCDLRGTTMGQSAWGQGGFGGSFGDCLKAKGWLAF